MVARPTSRKRNSPTPRRTTTLLGRSALRLVSGISEQQLVLWEHEQFIVPVPTRETDHVAHEPLYDASAVRRARVIRTLTEELEVNLAGIDVILHLLDQLEG